MELDKVAEPLHTQNSNLATSRFSNVNLEDAVFDNVNLKRAVFDNINLAGGTFNNVNLLNVRITAANTRGLTINDVPVHDFVHATCASGFSAVMPVLKVADLQRSIDWYCGVVGMTLAWRKPMDGGGESCMLTHGAVTLMLSTGGHLGGAPAFTGTLYINMPDAAAFHERIGKDVQMVWPLEKMSYGITEFGVRDPDGYVLAFSSRA